MPAPRKAEGQRVRRNLPSSFDELPAEGYKGDIPDWPLAEATEYELFRWEKMWRKPQAAQWIRMGIEEVIARYVRIAILAESTDKETSVAMSNIKGEARQLEQGLGLGAKALQNLSWKIVADEVEEQRETPSPRRRLRAVDPSEGAS